MTNRPLPVGIILLAESGGGAAVAVKRLIDLLSETSAEVHVLGNELPWIRAVDVHEHRRVILPAATPGSLKSGAVALRIAQTLIRTMLAIRRYSRENPDLVLLPVLTGTALATLAATLGLANPVIVCERNDPSRQRHGWHVELLKRMLYPRATAITVNAPGRAARDHLLRVSRGRPVHFVPNPRPKGIPPADVRTSRIILSVGRLVPQKGHEALIRAFARVHARLPDWKLQIAGDGPLHESLAELIERLDLSNTIELLRHVDDVRQLYASSGLFVLASDFEGTSNALLEAASAGLPCIVSQEITPPGAESIFLTVPARSDVEIANMILRACTDDEMRSALGSAVRSWVSRPTDAEVLSAWATALPPNIRQPQDGGTCRSD